MKHWSRYEYFNENWRERISLMASYVGCGKVIVDLGCGKQWLKDYIEPGCEYIPVDYIARSADTIICDFNKYEFPNVCADVIFVSGLLEYIVDVSWFIEQAINHADEMVVISYACYSNSSGEISARKKNNWVNSLSFDSIVAIFANHGMALKCNASVLGNVVFVFVRTRKRNSYGVLIYPTKLQNLGDYTQAAAAIAITGRPDDAVFLHREHLDIYRGKRIPVICNGWFSHYPVKPPSSQLVPVYISLHISEQAKQWFAEPLMLAHLSEFAPIGCRDHATLEFLLGHGVDAYYSACITLALGKEYESYAQIKGATCDDVYLVDPVVLPPNAIYSKLSVLIKGLLHAPLIPRAWRLARQKNSVINKLVYLLILFGIYGGLIRALGKNNIKFFTQLTPIGMGSARCLGLIENSIDNIKTYLAARAVITSRIHVALPATSAGAKVVFLVPAKLDSQEENRIHSQLAFFLNSVSVRVGKIPIDEVLDITRRDAGKVSCNGKADKYVRLQHDVIRSFLQSFRVG